MNAHPPNGGLLWLMFGCILALVGLVFWWGMHLPAPAARSAPVREASEVEVVLVWPTDTPRPTSTPREPTPRPTTQALAYCWEITPAIGRMCVEPEPTEAPYMTPTAPTCWSPEMAYGEPCQIRQLDTWGTPPPTATAYYTSFPNET